MNILSSPSFSLCKQPRSTASALAVMMSGAPCESKHPPGLLLPWTGWVAWAHSLCFCFHICKMETISQLIPLFYKQNKTKKTKKKTMRPCLGICRVFPLSV